MILSVAEGDMILLTRLGPFTAGDDILAHVTRVVIVTIIGLSGGINIHGISKRSKCCSS